MEYQTNRWDIPGVPHKGWYFVSIEDIEDPVHICEMCGHEGVRYVHVLEHRDYPHALRVGCVCAEKMKGDYVNPKQRETMLINRYNRKTNFLKKQWSVNVKGNWTLRYKGVNVTIMRSKYNPNEYGVACAKIWAWDVNGKKIRSLDDAKLVAFNLLDAVFQ